MYFNNNQRGMNNYLHYQNVYNGIRLDACYNQVKPTFIQQNLLNLRTPAKKIQNQFIFETQKKQNKKRNQDHLEKTIKKITHGIQNMNIIVDNMQRDKVLHEAYLKATQNIGLIHNQFINQPNINVFNNFQKIDNCVINQNQRNFISNTITNNDQFEPRFQKQPSDPYTSDDDHGYNIIRQYTIQFKVPNTFRKQKDQNQSDNKLSTSFYQTLNFPIAVNYVISNRYQILEILGKGAFGCAIKVRDLKNGDKITCIKILDRKISRLNYALQQINKLNLIKTCCNPDQKYLLKFYSSFFYRQHLLIETQLLGQDLLKSLMNYPEYFTIPILKKTAKMLLIALNQLHKMGIIYADLKLDNVLIKSYKPFNIKIIDFGNSFYSSKQLYGNIQVNHYQAPELFFEMLATQKIDIWSLGIIMAEIWLKKQLFPGQKHQILAKMQGILGPWPSWMIEFDKMEKDLNKRIFAHQYAQRLFPYNGFNNNKQIMIARNKQTFPVSRSFQNNLKITDILVPKQSNLKERMRCNDIQFVNFLQYLLQLDPRKRPSAQQALRHPFLRNVDLNP